jgi:hypothetical protein
MPQLRDYSVATERRTGRRIVAKEWDEKRLRTEDPSSVGALAGRMDPIAEHLLASHSDDPILSQDIP